MPLSTLCATQNRAALIDQFLNTNSPDNQELVFLAGDASLRKYYRLQQENRFLVFMDAPPPENCASFVQIAHFLLDHGFSSPRIIASDLENGFVLLEDFGDKTYAKTLNTSPEKEQDLYFLALDTLIDLHKAVTTKPIFLKDYSSESHLAEVMLLFQWIYPAIKGEPASPLLQHEYQHLWKIALKSSQSPPSSIVLRDYHVDNLMVLSDRQGISKCGLLDFQDALWGSVAYDVVSLLEDARRDIPRDLVESCWNRYFDSFPELDPAVLRRQAAVLSAARHAKILGIFTRLAVRDNKPHYLEHIPRVWRLLQVCLDHPDLCDLNHWFLRNFPMSMRIIPDRVER